MRRNKIRIIGILLIFFLLLSFFPVAMQEVEAQNQTDYIAYMTKTMPDIDGVESLDEWNDTVHYLWTYRNYTAITDGDLNIEFAIKYDGDWLYMLFGIDDNESDIGPIAYSDLFYIWGGRFSNETDSGLVISSNGTALLGIHTKSGYLIREYPNFNGTAGCRYLDNRYIFEVKLSLYYFIIKNGTLNLSLRYHDASGFYILGNYVTQFEKTITIDFSNRYYTNLQGFLDFNNILLRWNFFQNMKIKRYEILKSTRTSFIPTNTSTIEISDKNITSYELTNLSNGKYYFKLLVYNSTGVCAESNTVEVTINIQSPSPPMNLTATLSDSNVTLTWNPPMDDGNATVTEYRIYRGTSPDSLELIASVNGSVTEYVDPNVTKGETYYYSVSAVNSIGESNLSEIVSIEIPEERTQPTPSLEFIWVISAVALSMALISMKKKHHK